MSSRPSFFVVIADEPVYQAKAGMGQEQVVIAAIGVDDDLGESRFLGHAKRPMPI